MFLRLFAFVLDVSAQFRILCVCASSGISDTYVALRFVDTYGALRFADTYFRILHLPFSLTLTLRLSLFFTDTYVWRKTESVVSDASNIKHR